MKINFHTNDFLKSLRTNTRFMENLERKITNFKNADLRIYVTMHVLSTHNIFKNINKLEEIYDLLEILKIENSKFRLVISIKGQEEKIYIYFPFNRVINNNKYVINNENEIRKISIEYYLLYDAASDDAKKKYNKNKTKQE